jgi:hypothetical protein
MKSRIVFIFLSAFVVVGLVGCGSSIPPGKDRPSVQLPMVIPLSGPINTKEVDPSRLVLKMNLGGKGT